MKSRLLFLGLTSLLILSGCGSASESAPDFSKLDSNDYSPSEVTGQLGEFSLISPTDGATLTNVPLFSWNESTNARTYTLEICENERFISDIDTVAYYSRDNIQATSFSIQSELASKNVTYYWRVTAINDSSSLVSSDVFTFYLKAEEKEEVELDVGEADDWSVHSMGSKANIRIDESDFFGNGKPSLAITFKEEDTNQGIVESDGWIVVTKTVEKSIYGTDSLFFNLYYSGADASILIRLVDRDNEYWYCPVQISNNAKQSVILKFSDFIQRTKDVTVSNMKFDYERIKYMEVVFERSFGDGACLLSNVKAVKYNNYQDYFIDTLRFDQYEENAWTTEGYVFTREMEDDELTISYSKGISGYGFAKLNVNRYFIGGDAIKVSIKYEGNKGSNVLLRVYEEDTDRWSYKVPYSSISDEYTEFVIPFAAFAKSQLLGDGKRQFYFILNIQFGVEGQTGTGSVSFKDFTIVNKSDYVSENRRTVTSDGVIENFNQYKSSSDLYFIWEETENNKDEYMSLNSANKVGGATNPYCGQFEYKSDMEPAGYTIPVNVSSNYTFDALSIWMKDASTKSSEQRYAYLSDANAIANIAIYLITGEIYTYNIPKVSSFWCNYTIPFASFKLSNADDITGTPTPITCGGIESLGFAFHYFYYTSSGASSPTYMSSNSVYVDNFVLTNASSFSETLKEKVVTLNGTTAMVEDAENYASTDELLFNWNYGASYDYQKVELSNEVSSEGGNNSVKMQYQTNSSSVNYYMSPAIDSSVVAKGLRLSLKGDDHVTVYVNIYLAIGTTTVQYRATLTNVPSSWTEYSLGLNAFSNTSGSSRALGSKDLVNISKISFGAVYYPSGGVQELRDIYMDNFMFDTTLSFSTNSTRTID